jgi:DNA-binding protein, stimulates sugar fermentation
MIQGLFIRRISRRLAEVEVQGHVYEAYISNGIDIDFLESGVVCFLREAENENRRTPFDLYSVYEGDTLVCVDAKEPLRIAEIWASNKLNREVGREIFLLCNVKE